MKQTKRREDPVGGCPSDRMSHISKFTEGNSLSETLSSPNERSVGKKKDGDSITLPDVVKEQLQHPLPLTQMVGASEVSEYH